MGAAFLLFFALTIHRYFGITDVEQALFHMAAPLQGVDGRLVSGFLRHAVLVPLLFLAVTLALFARFPRLGLQVGKCSLLLWGAAFGMLSFCFTGYGYLPGYFALDEDTPDFYREHITRAEPASIMFSERRNLVVLYLESMEASFGDTELLPASLIPRLSAWRERHASVREAFQAYNTGWTIAGIIASWGGIPLRAGVGARDGKFLPNVVMVPDILARHGYTLAYVQGTSLFFTGKKDLFLSHGFAEEQCTGLETALDRHPDWMPKYHGPSDWGLRDSITYALAKERLLELAAEKKPFALFLLTVNPHFSEGFVEPGWEGPRIPGLNRKEQAYADVVTNADQLAADFLQWLAAQNFAKDTTVIVLNDHFVMGTALTPFLVKYSEKRRNLNMVINPVRPLPVEGRAMTHFDWAPTILESVGARLPEGRLGLGVSLYAKEQTLVERMGIERLNRELTRFSPFYTRLAQGN